MAGDLVLLTGSTGHIGFRVLRYALEHGYKVRAAVRSEAKAEKVSSNPALKEANKDNLNFVVVPDITVPGAFDEAIQGVKYVVHVASPLASPEIGNDFENGLIKPGVQGTIGVLEAARKAGGVQRIVITSSVVATVPTSLLLGEPTEEVFGPDYRAADIPAPYYNSIDVAYVASKIAALRRTEEWMAKNRPNFDLIHIHPSFVQGRDDTTQTIKGFESGTNWYCLSPVLGKTEQMPRPPNTVHVDDVALSHILALDPKVEGGQSFVLSSSGRDGMKWDDAKTYAARHFPEAVQKGVLPNDGSSPTTMSYTDSSKTEKLLGRKLKPFEDQVVSVVGHYLEVLSKEQGTVH